MSKAAADNKAAVAPDLTAREQAKGLFDVVEITDVTMVSCRALLRGDLPEPLRLGIRRKAEGHRSPDGTQMYAQVCFTLDGRSGASDKEDPTLLIEATFNAIYEIPEDQEADKEALDFFARTNGTFNLWPYWREFVQSTAARMGIPGLTVPTYRIEEAFTGPGTAERAKVKGSKRQTQRESRKQRKPR